jgi:hypothetical protein
MDEKRKEANRIAKRILHRFEVYGCAGINLDDAVQLAKLVADAGIVAAAPPVTVVETPAAAEG